MPVHDRERLCACGCGLPLLPARGSARYYAARFRKGHKLRPCRPRYQPTCEEIPSGVCECGCGAQTPLSDHTTRKLRHFIGLPLPFIPGHGDAEHMKLHGADRKPTSADTRRKLSESGRRGWVKRRSHQ